MWISWYWYFSYQCLQKSNCERIPDDWSYPKYYRWLRASLYNIFSLFRSVLPLTWPITLSHRNFDISQLPRMVKHKKGSGFIAWVPREKAARTSGGRPSTSGTTSSQRMHSVSFHGCVTIRFILANALLWQQVCHSSLPLWESSLCLPFSYSTASWTVPLRTYYGCKRSFWNIV